LLWRYIFLSCGILFANSEFKLRFQLWSAMLRMR
jgi:hypothetical protein